MRFAMRHLITERLQDIATIDRRKIKAILDAGKAVTIQFSAPGYSEHLLREVDALCVEFGPVIEVRFYGFYGAVFDASCLAFVPHVQWLSIDCLMRATALEHLFGLAHLRKLSLGIFDLDRFDLLAHLQLAPLRVFRLCETRTSALDLAPLVSCRELESLSIAGHTRGFEVLATLSRVEELILRSIPKKQRLEVVNHMAGLRELRVILGGRNDINEVAHEALDELDVTWVRGLSDLGSLGRFPMLRKLSVQDQIRLESIDLGGVAAELRKLVIINCKKLRALGDFDQLAKLSELRISRTAVDLERFVAAGLPQSLKIAGLYTGKKSVDEPMKKRLAGVGYKEFSWSK